MLTKILFTAAVIAAVLAVARWRAAQVQQQAPAARRAEPGMPAWVPRAVGYGFAGLILAGGGLYYYVQWRDDHQVVHIRVIDTRNGSSVQYRAFKGDIDGRRFSTVEGLEVRLADSERVEIQRR